MERLMELLSVYLKKHSIEPSRSPPLLTRQAKNSVVRFDVKLKLALEFAPLEVNFGNVKFIIKIEGN